MVRRNDFLFQSDTTSTVQHASDLIDLFGAVLMTARCRTNHRRSVRQCRLSIDHIHRTVTVDDSKAGKNKGLYESNRGCLDCV